MRRPVAILLVLALALGLGTPFTAGAAPAPKAASDAEPATAGKGGRPRPTLRGTCNLNEANQETLELLPGVGEAKALLIIARRKTHPFKRIEDLTRVKGIGRKTLARLKPWLSVSGPTTLAEVDPE